MVTGNITHNDLLEILSNNGQDCIELLKENLLQVEHPLNLLLDVGWYPSFDIGGEFQIRVVNNFEWDVPALTLSTTTINDLLIQIEVTQTVIDRHISNAMFP